MDSAAALDLLRETATAVRSALDGLDDWGLAGTRAGQYRSDLVADEAALGVLIPAGVGVLSEESGLESAERPLLVVVDPVDGSTNASRGLPWYATSLCILDEQGPWVSLVVNQAVPSGWHFEAVRGGGATCSGRPIEPSGQTELGRSVVALNGLPRHLGWKQYRALGAAALDLCAVACGRLDAYVDCTQHSLGPWDYLGGLLVCTEAGAVVREANGEPLVVRDPAARRSPVAGASEVLVAALIDARNASR